MKMLHPLQRAVAPVVPEQMPLFSVMLSFVRLGVTSDSEVHPKRTVTRTRPL